jgi:hypothetical protein
VKVSRQEFENRVIHYFLKSILPKRTRHVKEGKITYDEVSSKSLNLEFTNRSLIEMRDNNL